MTNQKQDAIIAGAIEDKPEYLPIQNVGIVYAPGWTSRGSAWEWTGKRWKPRPFISAPTWELDGIVLRWTQSNRCSAKQQHAFHEKVYSILSRKNRIVLGERSILEFGVLLDNYRVGMWALALLEVERNEQK